MSKVYELITADEFPEGEYRIGLRDGRSVRVRLSSLEIKELSEHPKVNYLEHLGR